MVYRSGFFSRTACALGFFGAVIIAVAGDTLVSKAGEFQYAGVNLSTAEFGASVLPGTYGTNYTYPTSQEVDYYTNKGMNTFRLPFRWERMQTTPNGPLDTTQLGYMDTFVNYATSKGDYVLIDPHNFERYYPLNSNFQSSNEGLIGGATADYQSYYNGLTGGGIVPMSNPPVGNRVGDVPITNAMFADFWGKMAAHYKNNSHVIFDLMNEPNSVSASAVVTTDNAAIAAIRANGATSQLILVEGTSYTGAQSWTTSGNSSAIVNPTTHAVNIVDPNNNWAVEMHQYMDSDNSGGHDTINNNDPNTGVSRITAATNWLNANHIRGFLGEFAVPNSSIGNGTYTSSSDPNVGDGLSHPQIGDETVRNMLRYMQQNSSAWLGWAWWGGGPANWWGNYMFGLDPTNLSNPTDKAAMAVLFPVGDFNRDWHIDAADIPAMEAALNDLNGWYASETALGLTSIQEKIIADVNKDGVVNNADLLALLILLKNGGGSTDPVPEPASIVLLGLAALMWPAMKHCRRRK